MFSTLWRRWLKQASRNVPSRRRKGKRARFFQPLGLERLEERTLLSSGTIAWSGPVTGDWNSAANWTDTSTSVHRLPTVADDVFIAAGNTVTYSTTSSAVHSLQDLGALDLTGGTLTVTDSYTQSSSGTLNIELGGTGAGQFDQLNVSGAATLDGTLHVGFINGFIPAAGDSFRVLTFGSHSADFASYQGLDVGGGHNSYPLTTPRA